MVLGSLLGKGAPVLSQQMKGPTFKPEDVLYVGLQPLLPSQVKTLDEMGVNYTIQDKCRIPESEVKAFVQSYDHILVHLDVDVLDEHLFHSTYFANPELKGDGSGGGKMTIEELTKMLLVITESSDVVGFTIAEYLPFDEHKLHKMFSKIGIFTSKE